MDAPLFLLLQLFNLGPQLTTVTMDAAQFRLLGCEIHMHAFTAKHPVTQKSVNKNKPLLGNE